MSRGPVCGRGPKPSALLAFRSCGDSVAKTDRGNLPANHPRARAISSEARYLFLLVTVVVVVGLAQSLTNRCLDRW